MTISMRAGRLQQSNCLFYNRGGANRDAKLWRDEIAIDHLRDRTTEGRCLRISQPCDGAAHRMIVRRYTRRLLTLASVLGFGLALSSCGGISAFVADHWPHWAGGMPDDVPPRPGAPGYDEFIAHGQADQTNAQPSAPDNAGVAEPTAAQPSQQTATTVAAPIFQQAPAAPAAPAKDQPAEDQSVIKGGLY